MLSPPRRRRAAAALLNVSELQHGDKRVALLGRDHILKILAAIGKSDQRSEVCLKTMRGLMRSAVPTYAEGRPN